MHTIQYCQNACCVRTHFIAAACTLPQPSVCGLVRIDAGAVAFWQPVVQGQQEDERAHCAALLTTGGSGHCPPAQPRRSHAHLCACGGSSQHGTPGWPAASVRSTCSSTPSRFSGKEGSAAWAAVGATAAATRRGERGLPGRSASSGAGTSIRVTAGRRSCRLGRSAVGERGRVAQLSTMAAAPGWGCTGRDSMVPGQSSGGFRRDSGGFQGRWIDSAAAAGGKPAALMRRHSTGG